MPLKESFLSVCKSSCSWTSVRVDFDKLGGLFGKDILEKSYIRTGNVNIRSINAVWCYD